MMNPFIGTSSAARSGGPLVDGSGIDGRHSSTIFRKGKGEFHISDFGARRPQFPSGMDLSFSGIVQILCNQALTAGIEFGLRPPREPTNGSQTDHFRAATSQAAGRCSIVPRGTYAPTIPILPNRRCLHSVSVGIFCTYWIQDGLRGSMMTNKPRLGRGLDALFNKPANGSAETEVSHLGPITLVAVSKIQLNPFQPRKNFDEDELLQLADSIRNAGVLQPLLVRPLGENFQLVAGERRLRAAQLAGIAELPVYVRDFDEQQLFEAALVENIQRSDLNPIEKAQGFKSYLDKFQMTQEQLALRLGIDRTTITNLVGLLNLPPEVQDRVRSGQISLGHAKVLKGLSEPDRQVALSKEVITKGLSVHALEALLKQRREEPPTTEQAEKPANAEKTAHVQAIEDELRQKLALRVAIKLRSKDAGQIVLNFDSNDDFERLLEVLRR
jgi:ParB family chromosome partitioning protein